MHDVLFVKADKEAFAVYHTIYMDTNAFTSFDWNECIADFSNVNGYFIVRDGKIIAGFALDGNILSNPFIVPPFGGRLEFWRLTLGHAVMTSGKDEISLKEIPQSDSDILTREFGAALISSQHRMRRPTEKADAPPPGGFFYTTPERGDIPEITETVYEAHMAGYTSTVRKPVKNDIENAIIRRYDAFERTNTLCFGTLARDRNTGKLAGVCIAGVYPDSANNFSTIHQVSVRPEYRRKGLAGAMIMRTISAAHAVSPVITLGVMAGNPAEILYGKLGFARGPSYSELVYKTGI